MPARFLRMGFGFMHNEPNTRAERGFLNLLAGRLQLPDALVDHIDATVAEVKA